MINCNALSNISAACRESQIQLFGGGAQLGGDATLDANNALGLMDDGSGSDEEETSDEEADLEDGSESGGEAYSIA